MTLAGLAKDCASNMGGIVEVLLANFDDVTALTVSEEIITAITLASGAYFHKYNFPKETGSLTSNRTVDPTVGANFVQTDLLMQFNRMETSKRVEIAALAQADLVAIVKDANGKYWYLGKDEPVTMTANDGQTGTARGDRNGYTITLRDNAKEMPMEVSSSIITNLLPPPPASSTEA